MFRSHIRTERVEMYKPSCLKPANGFGNSLIKIQSTRWQDKIEYTRVSGHTFYIISAKILNTRVRYPLFVYAWIRFLSYVPTLQKKKLGKSECDFKIFVLVQKQGDRIRVELPCHHLWRKIKSGFFAFMQKAKYILHFFWIFAALGANSMDDGNLFPMTQLLHCVCQL